MKSVMRQLAFFRQTMQAEGLSPFQSVMRTLMLFISILLTLYTLMTASGSKGLYFLELTSYVNIIFILVATVNLFCFCITEEKEGGTLGLLLMTGLSPAGLVFGKSLSRLYLIFQLIMLQMPLAFLSVTQGGVNNQQVLAVLVFCVALVVFLSQLGLFFSVLFSRSIAATTSTVLTVLLLSIFVNGQSLDPWLWFFNIFKTNYSSGIFGESVQLLFAGGILLFFASIVIFNRVSQDSSYKNDLDIRIVRNSNMRCGRHAIFDKEFYINLGGYRMLFLKLLAGGAVFFMLDASYADKISMYLGVAWLWGEGTYYSQTVFRKEMNSGTLQTLGVMPIDLNSLVLQKGAACMLALLPAFIFMSGSFYKVSVEVSAGMTALLIMGLVWLSHILVSTLCSIYFRKMTLMMTLISLVLFSVLFGFCPVLWLLILPTLVIVSVSIVENLKREMSGG